MRVTITAADALTLSSDPRLSDIAAPAARPREDPGVTAPPDLPRRIPGATVPDCEGRRKARVAVDQTGREFANDDVAVAHLLTALYDWEPSHV